MADDSRRLEVTIHRSEIRRGDKSKGEPDSGYSLDGPDILVFDSLFDDILTEPFHLANGIEGEIVLTVQRTHEWELVLMWGLKGAVGGFAGGAASALGKRFADWVIKVPGRIGQTKRPELRAQGLQTVTVDLNNRDKTQAETARLFAEASEKGVGVELVVSPGEG